MSRGNNGTGIELITNHEYELKMMLTEPEYERLRSIGDGPEHLQTNHYFDTPDFILLKSLVVVRIRQVKDTYELTVKQKKGDTSSPGVSSVDETTFELDEHTAGEMLVGKLKIVEHLEGFPDLSDMELGCVGSVATLRKILKLSEDMPEAELDKSTYLGKTDYEIEWEIESAQYDRAGFILRKNGINASGRETGKSKYGRLMARLLKERF